MNDECTGRRPRLLEGLASVLHGNGASRASPGGAFDSASRELHAAVEALKSKMEEQREAMRRAAALSEAMTPATSEEHSSASRAGDLERSHKNMSSSIAALHLRLGTGISEEEMMSLAKSQDDLAGELEGNDIESRMRSAIVARLFEELGPLAWDVVLGLMKRAHVEWPEPGGAIPNAAASQRIRAIEARMAEAERLFLSTPFEKAAESLLGIETAWKSYPDPSSWLWAEMTIRGVAAGIRCSLMRQAVQALRRDRDEIRARASEALDAELTRIRASLQSGIRSLEDAEDLVGCTNQVIESFVPQVAWNHVRSTIDAEVSRLSHV